MMKQNIVETAVGLLVLITAITFFSYAYITSGKSSDENGYVLNATFESAEGIAKGSDVMIAGIKVGSVEALNLNKDTFLADVVLYIKNSVTIPEDSVAAIVTQGLLGGKYITVMPGADENNFKANDKFQHTQSSINLESLIGKFLFKSDEKSNNYEDEKQNTLPSDKNKQ